MPNGRQYPPNLIVCKCGHEWTAKKWVACPKCQAVEGLKVKCGSKRKQGRDGLCHQDVTKKGGGRCWGHSRNVLKGQDHPNYVHGKRSKYSNLPGRYQDAFRASLEDPNQLRLSTDVALFDARRFELVGRLSSGESGASWSVVKKASGDLVRAVEEGDDGAVAQIADLLAKVADTGLADEATWSELGEVLDHRRKTVAVEVNRIKAEKDFVPQEVVLGLLFAVIAAGREALRDAMVVAVQKSGGDLEETAMERLLKIQSSNLAGKLREMVAGTPTTPKRIQGGVN